MGKKEKGEMQAFHFKCYIVSLFIFCFVIFSACDNPENDTTQDTPKTQVEFTNFEQYPATIYSDPAQQVVFAEVAANGTKTVAAEPAPYGIAFYPTFHLDLFGLSGISIPYNAPHIVTVIEDKKTAKVPIPKLESIEINSSFIKITNNSDFSLTLRQGNTELLTLGGRKVIVITGQNAVYEVAPGPVSSYTFMRNTTTPVEFPATVSEFKSGIIYSFTYTNTGLALTTQTSVLQSIPPSMPLNVQAQAISNSNVSVTWDEVYGATSYRIYRAAGSIGASYNQIGSTTGLSYTDTTISAGQTYYYSVGAVSGTNKISIQSPPVSVNMSPSNFRAASRTTISVTLAWNVFNGASGYNVYRSDTENGTYTQINTSLVTGTNLTDTDVLPDTTYYYKISAVIGENETLQSDPISASTLSPVPVNVRATASTTININIAWDVVSGASGYNVYRSGTENGIYNKLNTELIIGTTLTDTDLLPDTAYYYKVSSINNDIESPQSGVLTTATLSSIPLNVRSTASTTVSINLAWDVVSGAGGYNVYRSDTENGVFTQVNSTMLTGTTFFDTEVFPDRNYYYKVSSINNGTEGLRSNSFSAATLSSIPGNIRVSSITTNSVNFAWNAVSGASGYNVYRSTNENGVYTKVNANAITGTVYVDTGLSPDAVYYYKINSVNNNIEGISSNIITSLGVIVPGNDLSAKFTWLAANTTSTCVYLLEVDRDENLSPRSLSYSGRNGVVIVLRGKEQMRTLNLSSQGRLFTIASGVTLILRDNITLRGRAGNNNSVVYINSGGIFEMNAGSKVTGNTVSGSSNYYSGGGGVYVDGGTFIMNGGEVTDNTVSGSSYYGGGVLIDYGTFIMNGGEISNNKVSTTISSSTVGGGVYVGGSFIMNGGKISGNAVSSSSFSAYGGGVLVSTGGTITMNDGEISGNTAVGSSSFGGGVCMRSGPFTMNGGLISGNSAAYGGGVCIYSNRVFSMNGGEISGNSASSQGGGVYVDGTFRMSSGVIYGNTATPTTLRNTAGSGAALYKNPPGDGYLYTPAAEYGIINGAVFSKSGDINTTNTTIRIVNGNLQTN